MLKKICIVLVMFLGLMGVNTKVLAIETYNTTSTINGVTVNWQYQLNTSNEIVNLKCINPEKLVGSVKIPSTLDGKTVVTIGDNAFKAAVGITSVVIPDSVTEIEYRAFEDCTKLSQVDLGKITSLSFRVFKGCTSLTEITIPKTLKNGSVEPCLDNPNITKITLEEGLTIVPSNLCANTGITEITIPDSVTEIGYSAFDDCTKLKKITILKNVKDIGFYNIDDKDSVFKNHDKDLTIYCNKDSMAANYAIKYNIKYVYVGNTHIDTSDKEENTDKNENQNTQGTVNNGSTDTPEGSKDDTVAPGKLPQTGLNVPIIMISLIGTVLFVGIMYKKYTDYKDIK